jgi:hypothetical protein
MRRPGKRGKNTRLFCESFEIFRGPASKATLSLIFTILISLVATVPGCQSATERQDVRPLVLRDVPAQRLAYRLEADTGLPPEIKTEDSNVKIEAIQTDFKTRRPDDALLGTVRSPDGQRALALYGTEDEPSQAFRLDIYAADGKFLRNLTPPDLSCVFAETVAWSPDGNHITFIAHKSVKPAATPTPPPSQVPQVVPETSPSPSVAPAFPAIPLFNTEQIYICNRDGYDLKPLTSREGLIYFYFSWAPDNHGLVALACKEDEWDAREKEFKLPVGRPRLIMLDGKERLLDDQATEALPVWSPDSSKVATAFESDVAIYDAATSKPTQARIPLRNALVAASVAYEEKNSTGKRKSDNQNKGGGAAPQGAADVAQQRSPPASFNPIVRLEWPSPDKLYIETAYVRLIPNEAINTFQRWHRLLLSPQAAMLK